MAWSEKNPVKVYSRRVFDPTAFSTKLGRLPKLTIELTERCNNDCQHCCINRPARDTRAKQIEMGTDFIKSLILQAEALGCLNIRFTGGEPLLRQDFQEFYMFARRHGFTVHLSTNARLITPDLAVLFGRLPPGDPVDITVYGMGPETYDRVSGVKGSFSEFRRGVDLLRRYRVPFTLRMAVLPANRRDVHAYEDWIRTLFSGSRNPAFVSDFILRVHGDNPEKNRSIRSLRAEAEDSVDLVARLEDYLDGLRGFCSQFSGLKGDALFTCGFGETIAVDAYGSAMGCLLLRRPDMLYDLHSGTLEDALFRFYPKIREQRTVNPSFLRRCARCHLRGLCVQCPGQSWLEHGTLDTPVEFQCEIAHAHGHRLGLLTAGEKGWEILDWHCRLSSAAKPRQCIDGSFSSTIYKRSPS